MLVALPALLESVAFPVHLQDVYLVRKAVRKVLLPSDSQTSSLAWYTSTGTVSRSVLPVFQ